MSPINFGTRKAATAFNSELKLYLHTENCNTIVPTIVFWLRTKQNLVWFRKQKEIASRPPGIDGETFLRSPCDTRTNPHPQVSRQMMRSNIPPPSHRPGNFIKYNGLEFSSTSPLINFHQISRWWKYRHEGALTSEPVNFTPDCFTNWDAPNSVTFQPSGMISAGHQQNYDSLQRADTQNLWRS